MTEASPFEEKKSHNINIVTYSNEKKIKSPISANQFYKELINIKQQNAGNPGWNGWYEFRLANGKYMALNISMVIMIEEC